MHTKRAKEIGGKIIKINNKHNRAEQAEKSRPTCDEPSAMGNQHQGASKTKTIYSFYAQIALVEHILQCPFCFWPFTQAKVQYLFNECYTAQQNTDQKKSVHLLRFVAPINNLKFTSARALSIFDLTQRPKQLHICTDSNSAAGMIQPSSADYVSIFSLMAHLARAFKLNKVCHEP